MQLTDSGLGGSGQWTVTVEPQSRPAGSSVSAPAAVTVPGRLDVTARTTQATDGEATGYVVLTRSRAAPDSVLVRHRQPCPRKRKRGVARQPGNYKSSTKGGATRVARYRYPDNPAGLGFSATSQVPSGSSG